MLRAQALYGSDQVLSQLGEAAAQLDRTIGGQGQLHTAVTGATLAKAIAAMDQREAHAVQMTAVRAGPAMRPAPQRLLAGDIECALGAVKRHDMLAERAGCFGSGEIEGAKCVSRHADHCSQSVHLLLKCKLHLHGTEAAKRTGDAVVRIGQPGAEVQCQIPVGAGGMFESGIQHLGAMRGIGPGVCHYLHLVVGKPPLCIAAGLHVDLHGMSLDTQIHRLWTCQVQPHWALRPPGQQGRNRLNRQLVLTAIGAAHGRAHGMHSVVRQAQHVGDDLLVPRGVVAAE